MDKIVENVKNSFSERSKIGIKKYKTTLEFSEENTLFFLQSLQEELMDGALYVEKLKGLVKVAVESELTKAYFRILDLQKELGDKPIMPCDLEELFHMMGYDIDDLPF
jgi:hypothetical protein